MTLNHHRSSRWRNRRRPERQDEAVARQLARDARTDAEQYEELVARGHGHCAEARSLR